MENASRALIMAAGVFLAMLVLALLMFSMNKISEYKNKGDELQEIENLSKFNLQFTNYENRDVYGYELISLANKVANYNMKYSNLAEAKNDEGYNPITMKFQLTKEQVETSIIFKDSIEVPTIVNGHLIFKKPSSIVCRLFLHNNGIYEQSNTKNNILDLFESAQEIEEVYNGKSITTKLAKSINSLILSKEQLDYNMEAKKLSYYASFLSSIETYNRIVGVKARIDTKDKTNTQIVEAYNTMTERLLSSGSNIMKYYEYYQFKSAIFKCDNIAYDDVTGRVKEISFRFQGTETED